MAVFETKNHYSTKDILFKVLAKPYLFPRQQNQYFYEISFIFGELDSMSN